MWEGPVDGKWTRDKEEWQEKVESAVQQHAFILSVCFGLFSTNVTAYKRCKLLAAVPVWPQLAFCGDVQVGRSPELCWSRWLLTSHSWHLHRSVAALFMCGCLQFTASLSHGLKNEDAGRGWASWSHSHVFSDMWAHWSHMMWICRTATTSSCRQDVPRCWNTRQRRWGGPDGRAALQIRHFFIIFACRSFKMFPLETCCSAQPLQPVCSSYNNANFCSESEISFSLLSTPDGCECTGTDGRSFTRIAGNEHTFHVNLWQATAAMSWRWEKKAVCHQMYPEMYSAAVGKRLHWQMTWIAVRKPRWRLVNQGRLAVHQQPHARKPFKSKLLFFHYQTWIFPKSQNVDTSPEDNEIFSGQVQPRKQFNPSLLWGKLFRTRAEVWVDMIST